MIIKNNEHYNIITNDNNDIVSTTEQQYVGIDCHEKNGVMMMATASGIIKSTNGSDW